MFFYSHTSQLLDVTGSRFPAKSKLSLNFQHLY